MDGIAHSAQPASLFGALRVRHWAHFLVLPLASVDVGGAHGVVGAARGTAIAFAVLAFGYLLNGVSDRAMDRSAAKNPLAGAPMVGHHVHGVLFVLAAIAVGLSVTAPLPVVIATLTCLASGAVYSVGPRLKRFPVVCTFLNATNFAPLLWVGLVTDAAPVGLWALTLAFTALLLQNQLLHEAADREEDAQGRIVTTVRAFGSAAAAGTALLLGLAASVTAFAAGVSLLVVPFVAVFGVGFPLVLARRGDDSLWMAAARRHHRLAAVVAGALFFLALRL